VMSSISMPGSFNRSVAITVAATGWRCADGLRRHCFNRSVAITVAATQGLPVAHTLAARGFNRSVAITVAATRLAAIRRAATRGFNRSVAITVAATVAGATRSYYVARFQSLSRDYRCCNCQPTATACGNALQFQSLSRDYRCCNVSALLNTLYTLNGFNRSVAITVAATYEGWSTVLQIQAFQSLSRDYRCCNQFRRGE